MSSQCAQWSRVDGETSVICDEYRTVFEALMCFHVDFSQVE